jgi:hypothetical protein
MLKLFYTERCLSGCPAFVGFSKSSPSSACWANPTLKTYVLYLHFNKFRTYTLDSKFVIPNLFRNLVIRPFVLYCERSAHASPPTFVLTTQRIEYLAISQRNQDSVSRWKAKVGGQASLNCERDAHASPLTFVLTTQRLEYLAILQRNQNSISRWKAKVGGQASLNCERDAHVHPPTFVLTTQRIEYLAISQRNQDSVSRWKAKVGGQASLNCERSAHASFA